MAGETTITVVGNLTDDPELRLRAGLHHLEKRLEKLRTALALPGHSDEEDHEAVSLFRATLLGRRQLVGIAAGVDGVFLEVHDNPAEAKSDGANALDLKYLRPLLETLLAIHAASGHKVGDR